MTARAAVIDVSAVTVSGLCLVHCLALPLTTAFLPVAGVFAEAEWVHKAFVAAALPPTGLALRRAWVSRSGKTFAVLALTGLFLLVSAAFIPALHDRATVLTVTGALILGSSHAWRLSRDKGLVRK